MRRQLAAKAAQEPDATHPVRRVPEEQASIGGRIAVEGAGGWRFGQGAGVARDYTREQDDDRVAAGDHVVIGETQVKPLPVVDAEEPERVQSAIACERRVELAFDRSLQRVGRLLSARMNGKRDLCRASGVFEAQAYGVEHETGEAERAELPRDERRQTRSVGRAFDANHVHRRVGVQFPPTQHRRLEQVQAPLHRASRCRAPTSRVASMTQWRFTLCQISAA